MTARTCSAAFRARRYVVRQTFFDLGDGNVKNNKKIDTTISSIMFTLPTPAIAPHTQTTPLVLPQRNLLRQLTWGLPSGQAVAKAMRADHVGSADLADIAAVYRPFGVITPLWYYVLAEAKAATGGVTLGPVGGRIVAETLIGLLRPTPPVIYAHCPTSAHFSAPTSPWVLHPTPRSPATGPTPEPISCTTPE